MRTDFSTRWTTGQGGGAGRQSCESRERPYFAKRARARSCCTALRSSCLAMAGVAGLEDVWVGVQVGEAGRGGMAAVVAAAVAVLTRAGAAA